MLFDTHAHYYSRQFNPDRDELLSGLPEQGVSLVLCPGSNLSTSRVCIALAERYAHVYAAAGIHPQDAGAQLPRWRDELAALLDHPRIRAVGEIGLDYYWDSAPRPVQQAVFRAQMELAEGKKLPVILHDREAHADCLKLVRDYPAVTGVFHCFSGSVEYARELLALGYMISFTGNITFKNAKKAPEVIRYLPMDRILIETDAPYMAPTPHRGKRCDSTMVRYVAETIAELKGLSFEEVARITAENGRRLFGIDP